LLWLHLWLQLLYLLLLLLLLIVDVDVVSLIYKLRVVYESTNPRYPEISVL